MICHILKEFFFYRESSNVTFIDEADKLTLSAMANRIQEINLIFSKGIDSII